MSTSLPPPAPRPPAAQLFMAMPLVFGGLLMVSALILGGLVYRGFSPEGERVTMRLRGACAAVAQPVVEARIAAVGLGEPVVVLVAADVLEVTATLPGQEDGSQEAAEIPRLLSRRGALTVRDGEAVLADESAVEGASLQLDESGVATAVVTLEEEAAARLAAHAQARPEGSLTFWLDEERVADRPNTIRVQPDLRIMGAEGTPRARMAAAAAQVVVLQSGPLPCGLEVVEVVRVGDVQ